ncbi:MAG TPA: hypothetical protein VFX38_00870 [Gammaproteobacteria bacterium]|nr:hypothetical protein [Gammaproteobacteria bacterium]
MLKRLIGIVVTAAGVLVALVIGLGALLVLAFTALAAVCVFAIRSRSWRQGRKRRPEVIEGEFEVMGNKADSARPADDVNSASAGRDDERR